MSSDAPRAENIYAWDQTGEDCEMSGFREGEWTSRVCDYSFVTVYRRADLSPTLAAAIAVPEVRALLDALQNMVGAFDTPIARRKMSGEFSDEARKTARAALALFPDSVLANKGAENPLPSGNGVCGCCGTRPIVYSGEGECLECFTANGSADW